MFKASGWPASTNGPLSDAEKDDYINHIFLRDGVKLNKDNVDNNPGKRKVCLHV